MKNKPAAFDGIIKELTKLSVAEIEELQDIIERIHDDRKREEQLSKMEVIKSHSYEEVIRLRDKLKVTKD